jgi:D-glycero-alpha-D-manno-heptose-7-phosphate kinase
LAPLPTLEKEKDYKMNMMDWYGSGLTLVRARAPLRLGFAGGGTDVSPFCDLHGGLVMNATIDKYAYATVEMRADARVCFVASDQHKTVEYAAEPYLAPDGTLDLHKGVYNRVVREFNGGRPIALTLTTSSDAPAGSGLGASSTLVVAMLKAFVELLHLPLGEYDVAHLAYEIERIDIGLNGGKQDQYAATFGGFNFIEFYADDRVIVNPLRVKNWILSELEASLVLYYTGVSRASAAIIDEQARNVKENNTASIEAMLELKQEAINMKECILKGDLKRFAESMQKGWESKKRMAHNISNPHIESIQACAREAGAYAGKVSGAGGGGFIMFFVEPERRMNVIRALKALGEGEVTPCHFTKQGTEGWTIR